MVHYKQVRIVVAHMAGRRSGVQNNNRISHMLSICRRSCYRALHIRRGQDLRQRPKRIL